MDFLSQPTAMVGYCCGIGFIPSFPFCKIFVQRLLSLTHSQQQTEATDSSCNVLQGDGSDNVHLASAQIM